MPLAPEPSHNGATLSARWAASAAGGPGRGAGQTGDHGGAQRRHRGTRAARPPTNRAYTFTPSFRTAGVFRLINISACFLKY